MVKQTIQIFARIKPSGKGRTGSYEIDQDNEGQPRLTITVPRDLADGFINNKREHYKFRFNQLFDQAIKQDEIFEYVAKPVIDNVFEGYNGTIFAYGQTGSGKTFTITGGAEHYIDRGIIPRTLSYCFEHFENDSDRSYTVHISYLEIYNENGYDLLDPQHEYAKLEDLPKVTLMEDTDQNIHLKNLSVHQAANEEEALNLLFLGDTNRMIAETPMNQASTRSHCIFTIHLTSKEVGSATIRRAKLHLVDLAGSERVSKSGVNGIILTEAKYINLSLHYLEQVIIALSEKSRQHIPYRNSMMTSVLRDSLGGNCMTTMIATCSVDKRNVDESISTCRFAQRVAMIKNDVMVNEELDPRLMILKLKKEVQQLRDELALATGEQRSEELTEEEKAACRETVLTYVSDEDPESILSVGADLRKIHFCFNILKKFVTEKNETSSKSSPKQELEPPDTNPYNKAENTKLKELIQQRDNEINILVNMLKKEKKKVADALARTANGRAEISTADSDARSEISSKNMKKSAGFQNTKPTQAEKHGNNTGDFEEAHGHLNTNLRKTKKVSEEKVERKILGSMSIGRQEAYEIFRRDYACNDAIDDNKCQLRHHYAEAKKLGEKVNHARVNIGHLKGQIEQHRMQIAMQGLMDPGNTEPDEVELMFREQIDQEKADYKVAFQHLKEFKTQIEHLQHLLEKSKVKLLKEFELWWANQMARAQEENFKGHVKSAWPTPPVTPAKEIPNGRGNYGMTYPQRDLSLSSITDTSKISSETALNHGHRPNSGNFHRTVYSHNTTPHSNGQSEPDSTALGTIPLTGDPKADADIMAFMKARQKLLKKAN